MKMSSAVKPCSRLKTESRGVTDSVRVNGFEQWANQSVEGVHTEAVR